MTEWPPEFRISSVKSNWIQVVSAPTRVTDNQSETFAAVEVTGFSKAIRFAHASNQPPIDWLVQKRCADAALIVRSGDQIVAHVFEHKGNMTPKEWFKAKLQSEGMCANVRAALAVLGADQPNVFVLHVSFTNEHMNLDQSNPADLVLRKALTGSSKPLLDVSDWQSNEAMVDGVGAVEVRKIVRDANSGLGNCTLQSI